MRVEFGIFTIYIDVIFYYTFYCMTIKVPSLSRTVSGNFLWIRREFFVNEFYRIMELSRYVQSEIPQNLRFEENALDLRSGA